MLDTKWKNNKNSSFLLPAIAISAAVSILFMSLFPLFQKKAEESYIDPLWVERNVCIAISVYESENDSDSSSSVRL